MEMQEIDVFIAADGTVSIEVRGVQGATCLDLTKGLEAALGNQITSRQMTPDAQGTGVQVTPRQTVSENG